MILSLLLLMGIAQDIRIHNYKTSADSCNELIHFGKSSKKLSEIFPEECPKPVPKCPEAGALMCQTNVFTSNQPSRPTEPEERGIRFSAPEPLDVPAIQEEIGHLVPSGDCFDCFTTKRTTCADKTRILEHDEQPSPHTLYWCRKVQTKEEQ